MNSEITSNWSRLPKDFLDPSTGKKAGILEVRAGALCQFNDSFTWPDSSPITGLEYDSRNIKPGNLYFALPGLHTDGHAFIGDALKRGAIAVIHEKELDEIQFGLNSAGINSVGMNSDGTSSAEILFIKVKDSRFAMSPVSASFYNFPSSRMGIIGVTGTEGKSTTVYLIYQLLTLLGKKAGFISTVQHGNGAAVNWNSEHQTTPEAPAIHRLLAEMYGNGAEYAVLESSSHGLSKRTNRLGDVDFDVGVITNVTHEHLEFHGTWEQYRSDKAELFRALDASPSSHRKKIHNGELSIPSFGVANLDDPSAAFFAAATKQKTFTFSTKGKDADLFVKSIESEAGGNRYEVHVALNGEKVMFTDNLPGAFNAGNVLASLLVVSKLLAASATADAAASAAANGLVSTKVDIKNFVPEVAQFKPVLGRMTPVCRGQPFEVLVDYAHTPSSFETIFPPLRERLNASGTKLISVFGCPGERDTKKRKLQGEIAAHYSDIIILTDEDPRGEEPMTILEEMAQGCETTQGCFAASGCEPKMIRNKTLFLIPDRPTAIRKAFLLAGQGDLVLLLGKGHENSIIYADGPIPYDEIKEAETALQEAGYI